MTRRKGDPVRLGILASGRGTTLQALLDRIVAGSLNARAAVVISDNPGAPALARADRAGVPARVVAPGNYDSRALWNQALAATLNHHDVGLVILAGFMRVVSAGLLDAFPGRVLNIHPSLLPRHRGLNTYRRVLEAGDTEHGTSVHVVTPVLDGGPVIAQVRVRVGDADEATLRDRVQAEERWLYPEVIGWFADGRLELGQDRIVLDGKPLTSPVMLAPAASGDSGAG